MLESQIGLEYKRTMNKMIFDNVVSENRKEFAYVTTPEPVKEVLSNKGKSNFIFVL